MPIKGNAPYPEEEIKQNGWQNTVDAYRTTLIDPFGNILGDIKNPLHTTTTIEISGLDIKLDAIKIEDSINPSLRVGVDVDRNLYTKDRDLLLTINNGIKITEQVPTATLNASSNFIWDGDNLIQINKTINGVIYQKNFIYDSNNNLITTSEWVEI